jgi:hypothetical protein
MPRKKGRIIPVLCVLLMHQNAEKVKNRLLTRAIETQFQRQGADVLTRLLKRLKREVFQSSPTTESSALSDLTPSQGLNALIVEWHGGKIPYTAR